MSNTLSSMPATGGMYFKALGTARRKPGKNLQMPKMEVSVSAVHADTTRLASYRKVCGFDNTGELPITYPQVLAAPLHMWLMLRPEFPLPLMGLVHVRNTFNVRAPLPEDGIFNVRVSIGEGRRTHQGFEADFLTVFEDADGKPLYDSLMTVLYRMKSGNIPKPPRPEVPAASLAQYCSFDVPADAGRRYAAVSGDYNPIHMSALSAKAFGFPRAIAHGMWSLARTAALLESAQTMAAHSLDVQFRQPLFLPGKVSVKYQVQGDGLSFELLSRTSDKVHFSGTIV